MEQWHSMLHHPRVTEAARKFAEATEELIEVEDRMHRQRQAEMLRFVEEARGRIPHSCSAHANDFVNGRRLSEAHAVALSKVTLTNEHLQQVAAITAGEEAVDSVVEEALASARVRT